MSKPEPKKTSIKPWDSRLPGVGSRWQHESRLGTYDCTVDENQVVTLVHRATGKIKQVKGYDELKQVDVEPTAD